MNQTQKMGSDLLLTICTQPNNLDARLVYADWLEENGQEKRADLIRCQIELRKYPPWTCLASSPSMKISPNSYASCRWCLPCQLRDQATALLFLGGLTEEWFGIPSWKLHAFNNGVCRPAYRYLFIGNDRRSQLMVQFEYGFADEVFCRQEDWRKDGPLIARSHPVRKVYFLNMAPYRVDNIDRWGAGEPVWRWESELWDLGLDEEWDSLSSAIEDAATILADWARTQAFGPNWDLPDDQEMLSLRMSG